MVNRLLLVVCEQEPLHREADYSAKVTLPKNIKSGRDKIKNRVLKGAISFSPMHCGGFAPFWLKVVCPGQKLGL